MKKLISSSATVDVYLEDGMVSKVFHEDSPKTMALFEALTHARIEETGLPVPKIYEVGIFDGKWTIKMEYVEGRTLAQLMQENPDKIDEYIEKMLDLQLEVHTKRSPLLNKLKDQLHTKIQNLDEIDDVKKYDLLTRLDSIKKHNKVCHGNCSPANILITNDGKTYIVDWVAATQGNASADVGKTYLLLALDYPQSAEKYLNLFCQKTNTSKKYVQEWLPIVAAAQLAEKKAEEKDLCMRWLDVVDYE